MHNASSSQPRVETPTGSRTAPVNKLSYVFNRSREAFLVTDLQVADSHWSRFKGLLGLARADFLPGKGLWIVPSKGVHTFAMRFPIDVLYLNKSHFVIGAVENLQPWSLAVLRLDAASVLELPAGTIFGTSTRVGDHIEIHLESKVQSIHPA